MFSSQSNQLMWCLESFVATSRGSQMPRGSGDGMRLAIREKSETFSWFESGLWIILPQVFYAITIGPLPRRRFQNSYVARKHSFFSVFRSLQDKPAWSFLISLSNTSHWGGGENKTSSTSFQMSCDFFRAFAFCEILKLELLDANSSNSRASHIER